MNRRQSLVLTSILVSVVLVSAIAWYTSQASASRAPSLAVLSGQEPCGEMSSGGVATHHAGIVIVFPDGTDSYCIPFEEDEMSGMELLQRTGLPLVLSGFGGLGAGVCRIDDVGCSDPGDCFCQCRGGACEYWSSFELRDGDWRYLQVGASQYRASDGDVVGWVWANGRSAPGPASISSICPSARPTPIPTPAVTSTPASHLSVPGPVATSTPSASTRFTPTLQVARTPGQAGAQSVTPPVVSPVATTDRVDVGAVVVRQSTRPTAEPDQAGATTATTSGGSGLPVRLLAFAVLATGLVVVGGVVMVRRRISDR